MAIEVEQIHPVFVGRVTGVDLRQPVGDETLAAITAAIDRHAVLVFPDQRIDDAQQIAFSLRLGPLEGAAKAVLKEKRRDLPREIVDVSNIDEKDGLFGATDRRRLYSLGNQLWHTDASFRRIPARYSMLSARIIPPAGGETEFADLRAAWDALPEAMRRRVDGLVAEHSIWHSRAKVGLTAVDDEEKAQLPPVPQTLVRTHPGSKRRTLYLAAHAFRIEGLSDAEGAALIDELMRFATEPRFVYTHRWTVGDLVMWDNRCTMHRGRPYDDTTHRREMHRTTVRDHASTLDQAASAA
jgi:alpha-ketoglutarate-dependent 2,4-dichlorophenoxyacetate dioxygenase